MRWTQQRQARDVIAGRVHVNGPVSDYRARWREMLAADGEVSRVVLTPRRWRQVCGRHVGPTGPDKPISADDGGKQARSPGRARRKPL